MTTHKEALTQLLEAIDKELPHNMKHIAAGQRFNARTALAQPEQEPMAYTNGTDVILAKHWTADYPPEGWKPLVYTAPPQCKEPEQERYSEDELVKARKWAEETAKVLNEPEQEPTWWLVEYHDWAREFVTVKPEESIAVKKITAFYTTPPQRKPITDESVMKMAHAAGLNLEPTRNMLIEVRGQHAQLINLARAIEAAHGIKEKA